MRDLNREIGKLRAQQASAWVSTLARADADQQRAFVEWLKESPANVREFLLAYSIDQSLDQLDTSKRIDVDALLAQISPRVTSLPTADSQPVEPSTSRWPYRIAASIAALGLIMIAWFTLFDRSADWQEYRTGTGEQRALQLEDGTVVHLNAHSRIALNFSKASRDVRLIEGEALFEVHPDNGQRPFRVYTRDTVIRDIGTRFNVYSRSDGIKVAVIEGSVELMPATTVQESRAGANEQPVAESATRKIIVADQQARIDSQGIIAVETVPDISEAAAWWQRRLVYRNETLGHIVGDFNRYNRRQIRLEGAAVMQRSYTGVFDADDPDSLAQVLANDPELIVERQADESIVVRAR